MIRFDCSWLFSISTFQYPHCFVSTCWAPLSATMRTMFYLILLFYLFLYLFTQSDLLYTFSLSLGTSRSWSASVIHRWFYQKWNPYYSIYHYAFNWRASVFIFWDGQFCLKFISYDATLPSILTIAIFWSFLQQNHETRASFCR